MKGEGLVEILKFGLDDFRDCRDDKVIVGCVVGDIPGSFDDSANDFVLGTLDALHVGCLS